MKSTLGTDTSFRLYSLKGLILASFLGSMISGALLVYFNYVVLERRKSGLQISGFIVILWLLIMGTLTLVPDFPGDTVLIMAIQAYVMLEVARKLFGNTYEHFETNGGKYYSLWRCLGIAILIPTVLLAIFVVISLQLH